MKADIPGQITTITGIVVDIQNPDPQSINIIDIAYSLARQPRWSGHGEYFFSITEHSMLVADLIASISNDRREILAGLLHDASEAYVTDMPGPLKDLFSDYRAIEHNLQRVIAEKFNIPYPFPAVVHDADAEALRMEVGLYRWRATGVRGAVEEQTFRFDTSAKMFLDRFDTLAGTQMAQHYPPHFTRWTPH